MFYLCVLFLLVFCHGNIYLFFEFDVDNFHKGNIVVCETLHLILGISHYSVLAMSIMGFILI